jgi:hypothetical protein
VSCSTVEYEFERSDEGVITCKSVTSVTSGNSQQLSCGQTTPVKGEKMYLLLVDKELPALGISASGINGTKCKVVESTYDSIEKGQKGEVCADGCLLSKHTVTLDKASSSCTIATWHEFTSVDTVLLLSAFGLTVTKENLLHISIWPWFYYLGNISDSAQSFDYIAVNK